MRVMKWGNSLAVRLPAALVEALELKEGDDIDIRVAEPKAGAGTDPGSRGRQVLLARLREFRGRLPADVVFDRDEAGRG